MKIETEIKVIHIKMHTFTSKNTQQTSHKFEDKIRTFDTNSQNKFSNYSPIVRKRCKNICKEIVRSKAIDFLFFENNFFLL